MVGLVVASLISFVAAGALAAGQWVISSRNLVTLSDQPDIPRPRPGTEIIVPENLRSPDDSDGEAEVPEEFPIAEPEAKNFLITGSDNNACIDPDSPYAPAFGDRSDFGERSDTIMVWRVNPATGQVAVLSFPRDLYVDIPGGGRARINTAYRRDDPELLRATILQNFGIPIDHFVQVDFCAFKTLVDAVGGVEVPFTYPARDPRSGLNVPITGCFNLDGEHALAYVRSRYYEYEDPPGSGNWRRDGTSDLGRIARQQDFLRRTAASILKRGAYTPSVARALLETNAQYLVVDSGLTLNRMLEFAGLLQGLDLDQVRSYQIDFTPRTIAGNAVLVPRLDGENMRQILAIFRGEAALASAPLEAGDLPGDPASQSTVDTAAPVDDNVDASASATTTPPIPEVAPEQNLVGVAPPTDVQC